MQRSIEASRSGFLFLGLVLYALAFLFGAPAAYFPFAFFLLLTLGALLVLLLHNALRSRWGVPLEPYLYPLARLLPLMGLLGLPFFLFLPELFPWARPGAALDPILAHRSGYLNAPFMLLRYVLFFTLFSWILLKLKPGEHRAEVGAWGLPLAFAAATFLTYDLFMALEAHFYSASFGAILLLSAAVLALAVAVALAARKGTPALMGQAQNHTNLLLALSIIWIYVEATTLIIIWGGDLPHEVEFYLKRLEGPWGTVAALWAVGGFFLPFLYLLTNLPKREARYLLPVALWISLFRLLHLAWYVLPALGRGVGIGEVLGFLGLGLFFLQRLRNPS
ncbi:MULTISPECIES: hypothetical protein [Thermus]|uniref:Uncharacterized protein n=2 Tax=Thermus scotoductus TaxID=37636 RepID=A0A0N1KQ06_THESC|nr:MULTISPECIES: hypothetical protein [Thermus]ADW20986.1 putative membrane protein [Thermus scotoductus SA-01]KPD30011.1 hypothetical protein AN926_07370 [Thermus scotoductus]